jgi:CBS domain-containing protein
MSSVRASPAQPEWLSLVMARVSDTGVREPFYVDGSVDIVSVCRMLSERGLTDALVCDGDRLGMFTTTDLRDALLRPESPAALQVREVARFDLIEVESSAEVFDALWLMLHHRVHRLLVRDRGVVRGILGQLDLVDFVAHNSHIVALQIDAASTIAHLQAAVLRIDTTVELLHEGGIRIERIARLVGELNARLFAKLWSLLAPPDLVENSCLLVMGSEGRGEQIWKTDQDNALLLRDGYQRSDLGEIAARFNAALTELGYPQCPGNIMLTNPLWRQPLAAFRDTIRQWCYGPDPDGTMNLAIFLDAVAVAGDESLLVEARDHLDRVLNGSDVFLSRFAAPVAQFAENSHWWSWLGQRRDDETPLDLKKFGTFPIVHGLRALALRHRVRAVSTADRLRELRLQGVLDPVLAADVLDALHCLMALKLANQLRERAAGRVPDNLVRPADLGTLERDALRDALAIVKRLRTQLVLDFRLDRF